MRRNWLVGLALALAVSALIGGVSSGALWEPHEVTVAELSRRIGHNLLGGVGLALPGADNSVPIRADLGRGELPFTAAALGLRLFGLSSWAGRLPLAACALLGLVALYAALVRLWDRRAALYGVLILATTPLYFLQARTLLGDAVTLASFVTAWAGLAVATLAPEQSPRARCGFALLGALGLYAGFWCRGPIVSVAVPAGAIAITALAAGAPRGLQRALALGAAVVAALALLVGLQAISLARATGEYSVFVGSALAAPAQLPTFESPFAALAHACFPWSALAPLALALPWRAGLDPADRARSQVILAAALTLVASLVACGWLAASVSPCLPAGGACFAILVALALAELEDGRLGSPLLGVAVAALAVMLAFDLHGYPEKVLAGYGLGGVTLPETLEPLSGKLWLASGLVLALVSVLCLSEREVAGQRLPRFERQEYTGVLTSVQRAWDGNLVFALLVMEAGLVGFLLLSAISERVVPLPQLESFGSFTRRLVALSAVAVPLGVLVPLGAMLLRDLGRVAFSASWPSRLRLLSPTRAQGILCVGALIGLAASAGFYPLFSRQISPGEVFQRYRELRRDGESLGMLAQEAASARYQGGAFATTLADADAALSWLSGGSEARRRWLVLRKSDLPELNARFRAQQAHNLPILDARSSELLLASDRLARGERDENPLASFLLDSPPKPDHVLHAVLEDKLELLGWSLMSARGPETSLTPSTSYQVVVFYRVLAPLHGAWQAFVHLDGLQRRFNADHELLEGKYPLSLWRQGDVVADRAEVVLEPNFSPGRYRLYFGLFSAARRLKVTEGVAEDDRIAAGTLQVR
ncbi:MAG TPA: glycosyltransferase family 39 protein [Polyangiaceae bacterium]